MRKIAFLFISFTILLAVLTGCTSKIEQIEPNNVEKVEIAFVPEGYDYARTYTDREKIGRIVSYLNGLRVKDRFPENPDEYCGGAYTLVLTLADGTQREFIHFGNMFLRETGGDWKRMTYEQASELDRLVRAMPSD